VSRDRSSFLWTGRGIALVVTLLVLVVVVAQVVVPTGGGDEGTEPIAMGGAPVHLSDDYAPRAQDAQAFASPELDGDWSGNGWLFVAAEVGRGIAVYDIETQKPIEWIYSPDSAVPHHPYISPDQRWVTANARFGNEVMVIDTADGFATTFLEFPEGADGDVAGPLHGTFTSDSRYFVVALQRSNRLGVVDLTGDEPRIEQVIDLEGRPRDVYITPDDSKAFVTMQSSPNVGVIDIDDWDVRMIRRSDDDYSAGAGSGGGMSTDGELFAVSNDLEGEVVIIDVASEEVVRRVGGVPGPVNAEFLGHTHIVGTGNRGDGSVSFVDADAGELLRTVETGGGANITYLGPRGEIWVTHNGDHHVSVLDPETYEIEREIEVGVNPHWMYFTPWGNRAFVSNWGEASVSIVNTVGYEELGRIPTALNPNGMALKTDVTDEQAAAAIEQAASSGVARDIELAAEMVLPEPRDDQEQLFLNTCTQCHDLGRIVRNNASTDDWPGIVVRMRGNGAQMTDGEMDRIVEYLQSGRQQDLEFGTRYDEWYRAQQED
jgi:DNA-binding beta-propeller fold protein YncE